MQRGAASVIVCTRNRARRLRGLLESFQSIDLPTSQLCEFIVVDNGSTDETAEVLRAAAVQGQPIRYIDEPIKGLSRARNRAIGESRASVCVFIDDDARPDPNWLVRHVEAYADDRISAVEGRVDLEFEVPPPAWLAAAHRCYLAETTLGDVAIFPFNGHLVGANMSCRRDVALSLGRFNVLLGLGAAGCWEESEFSERLVRAGYRQYYDPKSRVRHIIGAERVTPRALRRAAFQNGVATYLGTYGFSKTRGKTIAFLKGCARLALRQMLKERTRSLLSSCPESQMYNLVALGWIWARAQGVERLSRRYGEK